MKNILITGGAGFIGSHVARFFVKNYPEYQIVIMDSLTYAGNVENIKDLFDYDNFKFYEGDIRNKKQVSDVFFMYDINNVIHLAAESHVDRSISNPLIFLETNIIGTVNLLEESLNHVINGNGIFYHISTDEVYGSLGDEGFFTEKTPYDPRSPYSASKASSDHFVRAYHHTYNLPILISNCSNNYGTGQYPEKMIPVVINSVLSDRTIPIYGRGINVRDWLWVGDHVSAIDKIFHYGKIGETYNIGGNNEIKNIDLVDKILRILDRKNIVNLKDSMRLIKFVDDRKGHDLRYAIDFTKLKYELGWEPTKDFEEGLEETIEWYFNIKKSTVKF